MSEMTRTMKPMDLVRQVGPPLLLLPLFVMSFDVIWLMFWTIGAAAALDSGATLLGRAWRMRAGQRFFVWPATRPLLTLLIVLGAFAVGLQVRSDTERYAQRLVAELHRACNAPGGCPAAPEGWQQDGKFARKTYGHSDFRYVSNAARSEFGLIIAKAVEVEVCVHGGRGFPLTEFDSVFCRGDSQVPAKFAALLER